VAVNQVSLFFYPPRWKQRLTPDARAMTDEGKTLQIADAVRVEGAEAWRVLGHEFRDWLTRKGFRAADWGNGSVFERGEVRSIFGPEKEIEIDLGEDAGEIADVYCRFTLPSGPQPDLSTWAAFVGAMCQRFRLRLGAEGVEPCSASEFSVAVRGNRSWREFAASCGWD